MKKKFLGKAVASIVSMLLFFNGFSIFAAEQKNYSNPANANTIISPCFLAIVSCTNNLILNSGGRLTCEGETEVQYGYIAEITMELQQYTGGWNTIKTWSDLDNTIVSLSNDWYVASGYQYRLKLTNAAKNNNGTVIESFTSYSKTVIYN